MKWQVYARSLCCKSPVQLVSGTNSVAARSRKTAIIVYVTYFPCIGNVLSELLLTDVFLVLFRLQLVFSLVMIFF